MYFAFMIASMGWEYRVYELNSYYILTWLKNFIADFSNLAYPMTTNNLSFNDGDAKLLYTQGPLCNYWYNL